MGRQKRRKRAVDENPARPRCCTHSRSLEHLAAVELA
eukprot:COSAG04_NODE_24656_length_318_cov_1.652968_1_plen_36_part_10